MRILYFVCVFKWYKPFSEGRESTECDQCPSRLASILTPQTVTKISEILHRGRCMSIRMIAESV